MYQVLCDDILICDSRIEELALLNPIVTLEENKAGSFIFTLPPTHPEYKTIKKRKNLIQVYFDEEVEPIFSGICVDETHNFYNYRKITCEGELTFFNDTIQRPYRYQGKTARELLEAYVAIHNAQIEEKKRFIVGIVTVKDSNDYISCYTNMESTMAALKKDLVDDLGGFFRTRHLDGKRYLDYLTDSLNVNSQPIVIGENLLDFTQTMDTADIATAIIPLGTKLEESSVEGLEERLTIKDINNGVDYVYSQEAVDTYGWIYKTIELDDVTTPQNLKVKGEQYLSNTQWENMVIEAKAIDLHLTDKDIERFKISDQIRVISPPHGMDKYFKLTKMTVSLNNPENSVIVLGKKEQLSLSAKTNQVNKEMKKVVENIVPANIILENAKKNASEIIKNASEGNIHFVYDEKGKPKELLIMDTDDINTARKVWRFNLNGLGYSSTGYNGEFGLALTMDGHIVADFIYGGTIRTSNFDVIGTVIKYASDYTQEDLERANKISLGIIEPTNEDYEKYDLNADGIIDTHDLIIIGQFLSGEMESKTFDTSVRISAGNEKEVIKLHNVSIGANTVRAKNVTGENVFGKMYHAKRTDGTWVQSNVTQDTFETADGKIVTVVGGIITDIVVPEEEVLEE